MPAEPPHPEQTVEGTTRWTTYCVLSAPEPRNQSAFSGSQPHLEPSQLLLSAAATSRPLPLADAGAGCTGTGGGGGGKPDGL